MKGTLTNLETGDIFDLLNVSLIGRSAESNILIADPRASRRHAMIRKQDNGFWFFDLGSFNGSYLNGSRVTAARQLKNGDVLNFADHEFRYSQSGAAGEMALDELDCSTIALIRSKSVIILVSDIRGFTALSERLSPDDLAQVIGSWYSDCETILANYGATVDKFIGDCVLAYWTEINEDNILKSVRAARDLLVSCERIYEEHQEVFDSAGQTFGAGVGLNTGKVAYGGMSQGEFTLVGDPVNLTFRIEALTRSLNRDIVATEEFVNKAPGLSEHTENLGHHQIKGRVNEVEIWGFHSFPD